MNQLTSFILAMPPKARFQALFNLLFPAGSRLPTEGVEGIRPLKEVDPSYARVKKLFEERIANGLNPGDIPYLYSFEKFGLTIDAAVLDRDTGGFSVALQALVGADVVVATESHRLRFETVPETF